MNCPCCNYPNCGHHHTDVEKIAFYVLVRHTGDHIGWYTHDVVAISPTKEALASKIEELKNRVPNPGELTDWEYEIQEGVELL